MFKKKKKKYQIYHRIYVKFFCLSLPISNNNQFSRLDDNIIYIKNSQNCELNAFIGIAAKLV